MICTGCRRSFSLFAFLWIHWVQTGCCWTRQIWERVFRAHRNGTSGKRILHRAFPNLYKTKPMPPEVIAAKRAKAGEA